MLNSALLTFGFVAVAAMLAVVLLPLLRPAVSAALVSARSGRVRAALAAAAVAALVVYGGTKPPEPTSGVFTDAQGVEWSFATDASGNATVTAVANAAAAVSVPAAVGADGDTSGRTYPVTAVAAGALDGSGAASVTVPATVESVGEGAFEGARELHFEGGYESWMQSVAVATTVSDVYYPEAYASEWEGKSVLCGPGGAVVAKAEGEGPRPGEAPVLYAAPASNDFMGNAEYVGWVRSASGELAGTLTVKAAKGAKAAKGGQSKLSIAYTPFGDRKRTIRLDKTLMPVTNQVSSVAIPGVGTVLFGGDSLRGVDVDVQVGRNLAKSKDREEKAAALARLAGKAGVWTFALATEAGDVGFSVTVDKRGKGRLAGTLPDGTRVSVSAQGVLGDEALAIPFAYSRKGSLGFVLWVRDDGTAVVSDLTALKTAAGATLAFDLVEPSATHALADGAHVFTTPFFEQAFESAGRKWTFPRQQKKLGDADPNPFGAKLSFTEKTGAVKGAFTLLGDDGRKQKYAVSGVIVGDRLYGTALLKRVGSVPVSAQ